MNALDIIILIMLLLGCLNGLRQGLIKAFTSFVGWIIAIVLAIQFSTLLAPIMIVVTSDPVFQKIVAFIVIVVCVIVLTWLISALITSVLKTLKLGPVNRLLGAAFGGLKSVIIILVVMQALSPWVANFSTWKKSEMVRILLPYAPMASTFAKDTVSDTWHELSNSKPDAKRQQHLANTTRNPFN